MLTEGVFVMQLSASAGGSQFDELCGLRETAVS